MYSLFQMRGNVLKYAKKQKGKIKDVVFDTVLRTFTENLYKSHAFPGYLDVYAKELKDIQNIFKVIPPFMLCTSI